MSEATTRKDESTTTGASMGKFRDSWTNGTISFQAFLTKDAATHFPILVVAGCHDGHMEIIPHIVSSNLSPVTAKGIIDHAELVILERFED